MTKILFKKIGMTTMFDEKAQATPVTVLKLDKTLCVDHKTTDKHGYVAAILSTGEKKTPNKPLVGQNKKYNTNLGKIYESRLLAGDTPFAINEEITVEKFFDICGGKKIKATAKSKGHGFSGTIKRWNFKGLRASHGVGPCARGPGSTGQRTEPGRTFKNKKMAGQYGHETVTISNLLVYGIDKDLSVVFVKGSVPGPNKGLVYLTPMKQKVRRGGSNAV